MYSCAVIGSTCRRFADTLSCLPPASLGNCSRRCSRLRVEPNPDIHVYAPGAEVMGYRVVSLNLRPVPHVRFEPVEFPESEIYYFEPLDERVPVYLESVHLAAGGGRGGNRPRGTVGPPPASL